MTYYTPVVRLEITFAALGIPIVGDSWNQSTNTISVQYAPTATQAQINQGNQLLATWDMRPYRARRLIDLINDLNALTSTQKTNISNDLFSGTPLKVLLDPGANISPIFVLYWGTQTPGLTTQDKNLAKLYAAAMYVQDNPAYLIQPTFDTTINVPGWEPIV